MSLVFFTYPYLEDSISRQKAQKVILETLNKHTLVTAEFIPLVQNVTSIKSPARDVLTVLEWLNAVLVAASTTAQSQVDLIPDLLFLQGLLIFKLYGNDDRSEKKNRQTQSALRLTKSCFVKSLKPQNTTSVDLCQLYLNTLLAKHSLPSMLSLSCLASAAAEIFPTNSAIQGTVEKQTMTVFSSFSNSIIKDSPPFPSAFLSAFDILLAEYATDEVFNKLLAPAIIASLPRCLAVLPALFRLLSNFVDISSALESGLLEALLVYIDAQSSENHRLVMETLSIALKRLTDRSAKSQEVCNKIIWRAITFSESTGNLLASIAPNMRLSTDICDSLADILKTRNTFPKSLVNAYITHSSWLVSTGLLSANSVIEVVTSGAPHNPDVWIELWTNAALRGKNRIKDLLSKLYPVLKASLDKESKNSLSTCLFALTTLASLLGMEEEQEELISQVDLSKEFAYTPEPGSESTEWSILFLYSSTCFIFRRYRNFAQDIVRAWCFYVVKSSKDLQTLARAKLGELYAQHSSVVGRVFIVNLNSMLAKGIKIPKLGNVISTLFSQASQASDKTSIARDVEKLVVLAHDPRSQIKGQWIGLCQKLKTDPKSLVQEDGFSMLQKTLSLAAKANSGSELRGACYSAISTLLPLNDKLVSATAKEVQRRLEDGASLVSHKNDTKIKTELQIAFDLTTKVLAKTRNLEEWYYIVLDAIVTFLSKDSDMHFRDAARATLLHLSDYISLQSSKDRERVASEVLVYLGHNSEHPQDSANSLESEQEQALLLLEKELQSNEAPDLKRRTTAFTATFLQGIAGDETNPNCHLARNIVQIGKPYFGNAAVTK